MKLKLFDESLKALLVIALFYVFAQIYFGVEPQPISWDGFGYYMYLPYGFLSGDLNFSNLDHVNEIVEQYKNTASLYQLTDAANGNRVIKYPVGVALMTLPFFVLGHFGALIFGYAPDGFSEPYQWMVLVTNWFYAIVGFIYARKLLLLFFNSKTTSIILFILFLGTNYLYTTTLQTGISHIPLFALYAMSLYFTAKWHESPTFKRSIILGLLIGLMIIVRHVEILFLFIPLFWKVNSINDFLQKYKALIQYEWKKLLIFIFCISIVGSIQLFYWKHVTGDWFFYSYDNPGEGFEFLAPYTYEFLFSFRKGWLLYTPLMIFGVIGVFFSVKRKYDFGIGLLVFFLINLWVVSSWSCWWYAGSFSQRGLIQSYPVMAIGLGVFASLINYSKNNKIFIWLILGGLIFLNLFQTWQISEGVIHTSRMTKAYYIKSFGKLTKPLNSENLLLVERDVVSNAFPTDIELYEKKKELFSVEKSSFSKEQEFVDFPKTMFSDITTKDHAWIKITGTVEVKEVGAEEIFLFVTAFGHEEKKYSYSTWPVNNMEIVSNETQTRKIEFWYITPEVRSEKDVFILELWNRAKSSAIVKNLVVEIFERK